MIRQISEDVKCELCASICVSTKEITQAAVKQEKLQHFKYNVCHPCYLEHEKHLDNMRKSFQMQTGHG